MLGQALLEARPAGRSRKSVILAAVGMLVAIAVVDYLSGYEIQIAVVYLIPIFYAATRINRSAGLCFAGLSSVLGIGSDLLAGAHYSSGLVLVIVFVLRTALFLVFVEVIAALRHALEREKESARTDSLTGVSNRRHFIELAGADLAFARRYRRPMTVAYLDLDNFKQINDAHGHAAGDAALVELSRRLQTAVRPGDTIARLGGDEFVALCEHVDEESALAVGRRLLEAIRLPFTAGGADHELSASIGIALGHSDPEVLLANADAATYRAKAAGRGRIELFR